ncbi:MAG TPA: hypothetical protein VFV94_03900 [Polyangiaceae bacterium]|nr:hypothetical protein [Polyangiaceae bacterium]
MPRARRLEGDTHNFGRRVSVGARWVKKPRTVFWEWLVLGVDSPLRALLSELAERDGLGASQFGFLPALRFRRSSRAGEVERLHIEPLGRLSARDKRELSVAVGSSLALFSWLGVADLHWENLALGRGAGGQVIFAPLDIEIALSDLALPTETKLLPDVDPEYAAICRHAAGVRRVLPYLGKPIDAGALLAMADAYVLVLSLLERHRTALARTIAAAPGFAEAQIRVCLRGTDEYVLAETLPSPPLLDAELEQLARGDIPYFFRLYGQPGIRWFANRALTLTKSLPLRGDVPKLEPLLSVSRGFRSAGRRRLAEAGLFALLGAFDHPALRGRHAAPRLSVVFGARRMTVTVGGETWSAPRALSALVGSVYLPCRCGEVRSVLVPPVTRCRAIVRA